ncbi:3D-(3,5/4)-trihydroxycyclohexane-1,2-dione hydrolase [Lysinibacillus sphaericus]
MLFGNIAPDGSVIKVNGAVSSIGKTLFAEKYQIPVTNTLLGLGSIHGDHELFIGMAGMHGTVTANMAITKSDLLLNIGARFDDRLTGNLATFAPNATIVHIDNDPAEIGKNVPTDIPIVADAKEALKSLLKKDFEASDTKQWLRIFKQSCKRISAVVFKRRWRHRGVTAGSTRTCA